MRRPHNRVELVDGPRLKTPGLVRHWADRALVAASCRVDGRLHEADALQRRAASPGGLAGRPGAPLLAPRLRASP